VAEAVVPLLVDAVGELGAGEERGAKGDALDLPQVGADVVGLGGLQDAQGPGARHGATQGVAREHHLLAAGQQAQEGLQVHALGALYEPHVSWRAPAPRPLSPTWG